MPSSHTISNHTNISELDNRALRLRLQNEISRLSCQMEELQSADEFRDLSLIQTYREMIFSRRALLGRIPR